jgi:hypothetical protein
MAIKISGTTVIDDSRNFSNVGIMTVGAGSSIVNIIPNSNFTIGTGITFSGTGSIKNISIAGTFTAAGLSIPLTLS